MIQVEIGEIEQCMLPHPAVVLRAAGKGVRLKIEEALKLGKRAMVLVRPARSSKVGRDGLGAQGERVLQTSNV